MDRGADHRGPGQEAVIKRRDVPVGVSQRLTVRVQTRAQIVEIVALVAENCFTNFLNEVAKTDIDFPVVLAAEAA